MPRRGARHGVDDTPVTGRHWEAARPVLDLLDCVAAEDVEIDDLANRFRVYAAIQPLPSLAGGIDCLTSGDESRMKIRNASIDRSPRLLALVLQA